MTEDEILALPCGAKFFRADLHIHSFGASSDVNDQTMTPEAIVATARDEGLDLIAITDHNEVNNVAPAVAVAPPSLTVIAGVELSTSDGHLLVYFESPDSLGRFFGKLDIADRGTPDSRCRTSMLECLTLAEKFGGFAVLAHVDCPAGLEERVPGFPAHKVDILSHRALMALELRSAESEITYTEADTSPERVTVAKKRRSTLGLAQRQHLARVMFSDSHTLAGLGRNARGDRRVTRIKMNAPSFRGLRIALDDPDARVRLEEEIPQTVPCIHGIALDGGFLDGARLRFSSNLTCIIGGRGAGKSTAFETVRCLASAPSENKLVDSDAWPTASIIVWEDQASRRHTVTRPIRGEKHSLSDPANGPLSLTIACYGQGETAELSAKARTDPSALLEYLDRFTGAEDLIRDDEDLRDRLLENQTDLEAVRLQVARIPEYRRALTDTDRQLGALKKANATEIVNLEGQLAEERTIRASLAEKLKEVVAALRVDPTRHVLAEVEALADPANIKVAARQYKAIIADLTKLREQLATPIDRTDSLATWLSGQVERQLKLWKETEQKTQAEIETKRKALEAQGVPLDMAFIRKLAQDRASHQKKLAELVAAKQKRTDLEKERRRVLRQRATVRSRIAGRRKAFASVATSALGGTLGDLSVSVKFDTDALSPEAEGILIRVMGWRTVQVPRARAVIRQLTVPALIKAIRRNDASPLLRVKNQEGRQWLTTADARTMLERLREPVNTFALERCVVLDLPRITVTKTMPQSGGSRRAHRDFSRLSLGQQQSVLLALMLSSDSNDPLIIDQPEDNLDSEFIYHSLVPALRRAKECRQVIVVTHNANIAVLGDAEQVIALKSMSHIGKVVATGAIDSRDARDAACAILEGSEEAFRRRAQVYGIGLPAT